MSDDNKILVTICTTAVVIIGLLIFAYHNARLHDEKMVQMGCNEKLISNSRIWECGKDK